jgi:antibiotic biosynthesis monooxygenase (ABM) superfamily enzyme
MNKIPIVPSSTDTEVTVVTQTRVRPEKDQEFTLWQKNVSEVVSSRPGFIKQTVIPPSPPTQVDWVILQRFANHEAALAWLQSYERKHLVDSAREMLLGQDDVHLLKDEAGGAPLPVSAIISTRIKPGRERAYRQWERKIAAAQAQAVGFEGYRFEEPMPGVQDDWLAIVRFDSESHLQAWLASPERQKLLDEAADFTAEYHTRVVQTGFEQWFQFGDAQGRARPPAWKQNMLVLMMLYPVVFLFSVLVDAPLLKARLHVPFWLALFVGNVISVIVLNWLVPWASRRFQWWLQPTSAETQRINPIGAGVVIAIYSLCLAAFSQFP